MITCIRTAQVQPGKLSELVPVAKDLCGVVKRVTGVDVTFSTAFGGNVSEVAWIWQDANMGRVEEGRAKMSADPAYLEAAKKILSLVIAGSARDQFWQQL